MTRYTTYTAAWLSQEIGTTPWWAGEPDLSDEATVDKLATLLPKDAQHGRYDALLCIEPSAPYSVRRFVDGRDREWSYQSRGRAIAAALWFLWCGGTDEEARELMARAGKCLADAKQGGSPRETR